MRTSSIRSDFEFSFEERGEVYVQEYSGREKNVTIPETWLGLQVTGIASGTFFRLQQLESVTVSSGVKTIDDFAFNCCNALNRIIIPPSVTEIDEDAVHECYDVVIYGAVGSAAQIFAENSGIPFKAVSFSK